MHILKLTVLFGSSEGMEPWKEGKFIGKWASIVWFISLEGKD
jgi:hypothetical protein